MQQWPLPFPEYIVHLPEGDEPCSLPDTSTQVST